MSLIETPQAQQANELAEVLATRRFPDGSVMLGYLDQNGHLKRVPTNTVIMTPDSQSQIPLNELNQLIAQQKGVALEDLAVSDGTPKPKKPVEQPAVTVNEEVSTTTTEKTGFKLTPTEKRSRADALYKEAAKLRKEADEEDPPKPKKKKAAQVEVE